MTLYPTPLDQRLTASLANLQSQVQTLATRTMGIDSGIPLMTLPGVIDPGWVSGNPKVFVNSAPELSGPYPVQAPYVPTAGQAVILQPVQTSYLVLGPAAASSPGSAAPLAAAAAFGHRRDHPDRRRRGGQLHRDARVPHADRRLAEHGRRPGGLAGGHQGDGQQRRRLLQRQLVPPVREPEPVHQLVRDLPAPGHPVLAGAHVRQDGRAEPAGLRDRLGDGHPVDRLGRR